MFETETNEGNFSLMKTWTVVGMLGLFLLLYTGFSFIRSSDTTRKKTKDISIESSAASMMKAIQVESLTTGDYSAYSGFSTMKEEGCTHYAEKSPNKDALQAACRSILQSNQGSGCESDASCLWSNSLGANYPKLSIMVWLPFEKKYYCIGSNGESSKTANGNWNSPGCAGDQNANRN